MIIRVVGMLWSCYSRRLDSTRLSQCINYANYTETGDNVNEGHHENTYTMTAALSVGQSVSRSVGRFFSLVCL